jgi:hypothetical protein
MVVVSSVLLWHLFTLSIFDLIQYTSMYAIRTSTLFFKNDNFDTPCDTATNYSSGNIQTFSSSFFVACSQFLKITLRCQRWKITKHVQMVPVYYERLAKLTFHRIHRAILEWWRNDIPNNHWEADIFFKLTVTRGGALSLKILARTHSQQAKLTRTSRRNIKETNQKTSEPNVNDSDTKKCEVAEEAHWGSRTAIR